MRVGTYNFFKRGTKDFKAPYEVLIQLQPDLFFAQELRNPREYVEKTNINWPTWAIGSPIWSEVAKSEIAAKDRLRID
jgi:hypothetical protein